MYGLPPGNGRRHRQGGEFCVRPPPRSDHIFEGGFLEVLAGIFDSYLSEPRDRMHGVGGRILEELEYRVVDTVHA